MQIGRAMLEQFGVPDLSTFYFSPVSSDVKDIRFTWLGDITLYLIYRLTGDVGLQLLRLVCAIFSCAALLSIPKQRYNTKNLLILMLFVAGTYQLQVMRNAIFGLPFTTVLLWGCHRIEQEKDSVWIWFIPILIGIWGCMHGSYLLGFGLYALFILGTSLEALRGQYHCDRKVWFKKLVSLALSLLFISIYNPLTTGVISKVIIIFAAVWPFLLILIAAGAALVIWGVKHRWKRITFFYWVLAILILACSVVTVKFLSPYLADKSQVAHVDLRAPDQYLRIEEIGFFGQIKEALNNTFWDTKNNPLSSSDFQSPFDHLGDIYIWASLLLAVLVLIHPVFLRKNSLSFLLPFMALMVLGMGYVRLTGFIAVISTFLLMFMGPSGMGKRFPSIARLPMVGVGAMLIWLILSLAKLPLGLGLWETHVAGPGRAPYYSSECITLLKDRHGDAPVFTTIKNGGFILYNWYPEKKVFMDGFFAPHAGKTFDDYTKILLDNAPDRLVDLYGIRLAVITLEDLKWINVFSKSKNWYPRYMDTGMLVFAYQPVFSDPIKEPEILFGVKEMRALPSYYSEVVLNRLYELGSSLVIKGRLVEANQFLAKHKNMFEQLDAWLVSPSRQRMEENLAQATQRYGGQNTEILYHEFLYSESKRIGKFAEALSHGEKVLAANGDNYLLLLDLVDVAFTIGEVDKVIEFLGRLWKSSYDDQELWHRERRRISEYYIRAARAKQATGAYINAYNLMYRAHNADGDYMPADQVVNWGLQVYSELEARSEIAPAYDLLKAMEVEFYDAAYLLYNISWHIFRHHDTLGVSLETAMTYAENALNRALQKGSVKGEESYILDIIYDHQAQIYHKMGEIEKAYALCRQAVEAAPADRRGLYQERILQWNKESE